MNYNPLSEALRKGLGQKIMWPDDSKAVTTFLGYVVKLECSEKL